VHQWRERMPVSPIFATEDYLTGSADVFPLEFLDMREAHETVFGNDPLAELSIDPRMLRHQVEAEMKGKLMRLRTAYASVAGHPTAVRDLMRDSLSSFRILFRGALRLSGETPPLANADIMHTVAKRFDLDTATLDDVLAVHERRGRAQAFDLDALFGRYLIIVERLVAVVDTWNVAPETEGNG
jgi:hypothetical protein